ncbi:MAG: hypothetical protein VX278_03045 [Myxococcota bacterium]|nr:hypothetical protein [Myxococcota bacterium]
MSNQSNIQSTWRMPFNPPSEQAQQLAERTIRDLRQQQRHKYWDVEYLQEGIRKNGLEAVLEELSSAEEPDSTELHQALSEENDRIGNWNQELEPQKFLVMWRDRAKTEQWDDICRQADNMLFDHRWASLQRLCDIKQTRGDLGFDPNRIGLMPSANGKYLLDIEQEFITVWNPQTGKPITSWNPPISIRSAVALYDDLIAIGLQDGTLFHWELSEDTQYEVIKIEGSIDKIASKEDYCVLCTQNTFFLIDEDGTLEREIPNSFD